MIIEMSIERVVTFEILQKALSFSFSIDLARVLTAEEYWNLSNLVGWLGVNLSPDEGEFQTYVIVHEYPDVRRNPFVMGSGIVSVLGCKVALPYPEDEDDDDDPRKLVIFSPDGRKFVGYGESIMGKFEISSVAEILMN